MRCNWGCSLADKSNNVCCKILRCLNELNVVQCNILNEKQKRCKIGVGNAKTHQVNQVAGLQIQMEQLGLLSPLPASTLGPKQAGVFVDNPKCHNTRVCEALCSQER